MACGQFASSPFTVRRQATYRSDAVDLRSAVSASSPPASSRLQHQPSALNRIAVEPFEEADAEQVFAEGAGAGDQLPDVADDDWTDGKLIEPRLGGHRGTIGGGDAHVIIEPGCVDADLLGVLRADDDRRGAGIEQE